MHIHNQPVNLYATNIHSPATVAAQQAAAIRRRLARATSSLSEESDPFESFMVGHAPLPPHGYQSGSEMNFRCHTASERKMRWQGR
jgi:hypothetical protein